MAGGQIRRGSTLLVEGTHQNPDKRHLCIILNDLPSDGSQQFLYVPIITARGKFDATCILDAGDHQFIDHESCVHYARAEVRHVEQLLRRGELCEPLVADVLEKVCAGVFKSPHSRPFIKKFYNDYN